VKRARKLTCRPAIDRFQRIVKLTSGGGRSLFDLAGELEVSMKTISRDIEFMRDRLGVVIEVTNIGKRYVYRLTSSEKHLCQICLGRVN
jgi:predicted DNA-binding transcriptional regulator YafY